MIKIGTGTIAGTRSRSFNEGKGAKASLIHLERNGPGGGKEFETKQQGAREEGVDRKGKRDTPNEKVFGELKTVNGPFGGGTARDAFVEVTPFPGGKSYITWVKGRKEGRDCTGKRRDTSGLGVHECRGTFLGSWAVRKGTVKTRGYPSLYATRG